MDQGEEGEMIRVGVIQLPEVVHQFKIELLDTDPVVWRRFRVPHDMPLDVFHRTIQLIMDWKDQHLHQFIISNKRYGPGDEESYSTQINIGRDHSIEEVIPLKEGFKFIYEYDFGDRWIHGLTLEKVFDATKDNYHPYCLEGERACPPEDCDGPFGFERILNTLKRPKDPEVRELLNWVGDYDPSGFKIDEVNRHLAGLIWIVPEKP